jgi:hypothetical protein
MLSFRHCLIRWIMPCDCAGQGAAMGQSLLVSATGWKREFDEQDPKSSAGLC